MERSGFYRRVLGELLDGGLLRRDMSVLVVAGGPADRDVLLSLGFERVTISNVDEEVAPETLAPYAWAYQDAESLGYEDASFDVTVVSAGVGAVVFTLRPRATFVAVSAASTSGFNQSWTAAWMFVGSVLRSA